MRILLSLTLLWTANTFAVEPVELIEEVKLTNGLILEANNIDRIRFNRFDSKKVDWIESKDGVYLDRYDIERVELKLPNNPRSLDIINENALVEAAAGDGSGG
ncbi:MAG: hypothetical protein CME62_15040 [Halobacteriovoraceae bacterium]|nr:hypothetical protein [Halobacteriovoraceae bacterium]|tara:strand:+ start:11486 stop:11794 length:309 start_codon:yes stop_codon:yes gene_type:complete